MLSTYFIYQEYCNVLGTRHLSRACVWRCLLFHPAGHCTSCRAQVVQLSRPFVVCLDRDCVRFVAAPCAGVGATILRRASEDLLNCYCVQCSDHLAYGVGSRSRLSWFSLPGKGCFRFYPDCWGLLAITPFVDLTCREGLF